MKYSIFGFSQKELLNKGLNLNHAAILRWFIDYFPAKGMVKIIVDGEQYGWVKYSAVIEEFPCIGIKSKDRVYRLFMDLVNCGILDRYTLKQGGTFSYFKPGNEYLNLISDTKKNDDSLKTTEPSVKNNGTGYVEKTGTNNPSTNYNQSTKSNKKGANAQQKKTHPLFVPTRDAYFKAYEEKTGRKPKWGGKEGKLLNDMLKRDFDETDIMTAMQLYFSTKDEFTLKQGYDAGYLFANIHKILNGSTLTKEQLKQHEASQDLHRQMVAEYGEDYAKQFA